MTISAMRNDNYIRQQKIYNNNSQNKTKFVTKKNNIPNQTKNPKFFVRDQNAKIQIVQNPAPKASSLKTEKPLYQPTKSKMSIQVRETSNDENVVVQISNSEMDYYNVRIFVVKYFLDHNRDLNNDTTLRILDKTINKILKHLNKNMEI